MHPGSYAAVLLSWVKVGFLHFQNQTKLKMIQHHKHLMLIIGYYVSVFIRLMFTDLHFVTDMTEKHRRQHLFIKSLVAIWDPEVSGLCCVCFFISHNIIIDIINQTILSFSVECLSCHAVSDTFEPFLDILLEIKVTVSPNFKSLIVYKCFKVTNQFQIKM